MFLKNNRVSKIIHRVILSVQKCSWQTLLHCINMFMQVRGIKIINICCKNRTWEFERTLVRIAHRPEHNRVWLELSDFGNVRVDAQSEQPIFDGQPGVTSADRVWQTGSYHGIGVCLVHGFCEWTTMIGEERALKYS